MRLVKALVICSLWTSLGATAQEQRKNPPTLPPASGYSHVVVAPAGRLVVISGQVALNEKGELIGAGDFETQCVQVHENIKKALASLGLTFSDVIRTDNYITDRKHLPLLRKVRQQYLPTGKPPASTLLVVEGLFAADLLVEVSVEAVIPYKQGVAH